MDKQYPVRQWAHGADLVVQSSWKLRGYARCSASPALKSTRSSIHCWIPSIRIIPVRHEANAAFMAAAVGRITGKAGVALVTSGPGCSNLITGMATANSEGDPVVALGGAVKRADKAKQVHPEYGYGGDVQPGNQIRRRGDGAGCAGGSGLQRLPRRRAGPAGQRVR
ncbi:acetolactate synthase [Klebsiella pneumoniae]|uniref:Acetolactate synthase n=1 Tax=Klebsiella pneumoniae TaxID=573 RepID=A0A447S838_KLEPN|nr:acetolactate synthase [Klebsiella pneumoniae]